MTGIPACSKRAPARRGRAEPARAVSSTLNYARAAVGPCSIPPVGKQHQTDAADDLNQLMAIISVIDTNELAILAKKFRTAANTTEKLICLIEHASLVEVQKGERSIEVLPLSPLLYSAHVNDIMRTLLGVQLALFPDDSGLNLHGQIERSICPHLQRTIDELGRWFQAWKIEVNLEKSMAISFIYRKGHLLPRSGPLSVWIIEWTQPVLVFQSLCVPRGCHRNLPQDKSRAINTPMCCPAAYVGFSPTLPTRIGASVCVCIIYLLFIAKGKKKGINSAAADGKTRRRGEAAHRRE
ncbi:hypothetical protein EVAR_42424_1 [Eumeta japonica]|uniref:RNA-directed DNA polymerase from mobile element jockey n=1 Tax=Eumeta variegata TaxID=151549 RepID=A0A4C1XAZ6_EUMVA|nr:hypothetical protein EVAR_42424_1 [Eumeta japonica]